MAFLPEIAARTDAVVNITTGGSAIMTLDDRLAGARAGRARNVLAQHGQHEFRALPGGGAHLRVEARLGEAFPGNSDDLVFKNTPRDIAQVLAEMGERRGARFEFECYDLGHLYMLKHFVDRGLAKPPLFLQFVLGVLGGAAAEPGSSHAHEAHRRPLFGEDYAFSVLAAGRMQMPLAAMAAGMGGHVRVGLEDNLWLEKGRLARSNAEQVTRIREIVERLGRRVATPDEARAMLGLKGRAATAFAP
jgi:uncharacterized protein (DUF849 family)